MSLMLGQYLRQFGQKLVRRKPQFREEPEGSETHPPNTLDLVVIGLDHMLGAGIYILIGGVAKYIAGPTIILFLLVAGLTTVLSGLCYVELAARVERPVSGYFVIYVTMGQLYAFISGWNLLLYLIIGETMGSGERWEERWFGPSLLRSQGVTAVFCFFSPLPR